jgi:hypothetical protein
MLLDMNTDSGWERSTGATPVPPVPPPHDPMTPTAQGFPAAPSFPQGEEPARGGRRFLLAAVIGIAVAVAVVAFLSTRGAGDGLPDRLGTVARIDSGPTAQLLDAFSDMEFGGVSFRMAAYGDPANPRYIAMLLSGDLPNTGAQSLLEGLPTGVVGDGASSIDFSKAVTANDGDTDYVCAPASGAQGGQQVSLTMCIEQHRGGASVLMAMADETPQSLLRLAKDLRASL